MVPVIESCLLAGEIGSVHKFSLVLENLGLKNDYRCSYADPRQIGWEPEQVSLALIELRVPVDDENPFGGNCFRVGWDTRKHGIVVTPLKESIEGRSLGKPNGISLAIGDGYNLGEKDINLFPTEGRGDRYGFSTVMLWNRSIGGEGGFVEIESQAGQSYDHTYSGGTVLIPYFNLRRVYVLPMKDILQGDRALQEWQKRFFHN